MSEERYFATIITKERGKLYLGAKPGSGTVLGVGPDYAFRYYDIKTAKAGCDLGKKRAKKEGLTVVSTAVIVDLECWQTSDWKKPKATKSDTEIDAVHSPVHYQLANGTEAIDIIDALVYDPPSFWRGNAIKYLLRAGKKGDARQDLEKARYYIDREINDLHESQ